VHITPSPWAFAASTLLGLAAFGGATVNGADSTAIPDFARDSGAAWVPSRLAGDEFLQPPSGAGPVVSAPGHPYSPNQGTLGQSTFRVADLNNPVLQPWVRERMKKANDDVLAGKIPFTARERCWPGGVPDFDIYERDRPVFWIQTPKEIVIVNEHDAQTRHIYLNVPHSAKVKPSWYGESVGHFEGGTLVVDTIGQNDRSFVDNYRTPHTTQLHVVERFSLKDGGRTLHVLITLDDPGAFSMPWSAVQEWTRRDNRPITELICAENNAGYFNYNVTPVPTAARPDF
jgi:hypothetical protein